MANEKILLVEDERELAQIIRDFLKKEGYVIHIAQDGEAALEAFDSYQPQLVILDIMLPKIDGLEVCRQLRGRSEVPVLMLSAKGSEVDKIIGLGLGADDYITKPFGSGELLARVKAHLRRYRNTSSPAATESAHQHFGRLDILDEAYTVLKDGQDVGLVAKEFELLCFLARHANRVFTREQLFNRIWGYDGYGDVSTVTVHIRKLREKIEDDPSRPVYIKTVWGVGYKFEGEAL